MPTSRGKFHSMGDLYFSADGNANSPDSVDQVTHPQTQPPILPIAPRQINAEHGTTSETKLVVPCPREAPRSSHLDSKSQSHEIHCPSQPFLCIDVISPFPSIPLPCPPPTSPVLDDGSSHQQELADPPQTKSSTAEEPFDLSIMRPRFLTTGLSPDEDYSPSHPSLLPSGSFQEGPPSSPGHEPSERFQTSGRPSTDKRKRKPRSTVSDVPKYLLTDIGSIRDAVSHPGAVPKPPPPPRRVTLPLSATCPDHSLRPPESPENSAASPPTTTTIEVGRTMSAVGDLPMREPCLYCAPIAAIPGILTLTMNAITFEPDPRSQFVRDYGIGQFQVYIDLNDVPACAAIMLPDGPLLTQYLGFHHDINADPQHDTTYGAFSSFILPLPPRPKGPTPSFFQVLVRTSSGRPPRIDKGRRGISGLLKRDTGPGSSTGVRRSPLLQAASSTVSVESSQSLPERVAIRSRPCVEEIGFRRRKSIGTVKDFYSAADSELPSRVDRRRSNGSYFRAAAEHDSEPSRRITRIQSFPATAERRHDIPTIVHSLSTPSDSFTKKAEAPLHPIAAPRSLSPRIFLSPESGSKARRFFSSLSSWTKRLGPLEDRLPPPLHFTGSPPPSPRRAATDELGLRDAKGRRSVPESQLLEVVTGKRVDNMKGKGQTIRKDRTISFPEAEKEFDLETVEPSTDSVLFRFPDHVIVRKLTQRTMGFIERREELRKGQTAPLSSVQPNLGQRRHSTVDQKALLVDSKSTIQTAISLGNITPVSPSWTSVPYFSSTIFDAFLLSPRTQQNLIDNAEAQLTGGGAAATSGIAPNRLDVFVKSLGLLPQRLRSTSSLSKQKSSGGRSVELEPPNKKFSESRHSSSVSGASGASLFWSPVIDSLEGAPLLMTPHVAEELVSYVPSTLSIRNWKLTFCTKIHGISFQTFFRLLDEAGPCLLLICDTRGSLFGAFCSTSIRECSHYYGTGETFVFAFNRLPPYRKYTRSSQATSEPQLQRSFKLEEPPTIAESVSVFPWSGRNSFFVFSNSKSIAVGGGGSYAITVDASFLRGSSSPCATFNSPCLASSSDFLVRYFQVWCFKDPV